MKKIIKPILNAAEEIAQEAKRQITMKPPAPEETLGQPTKSVNPQQRQQVEQRDEKQLGQLRMEKAQLLGQWRQQYNRIQTEQYAAFREKVLQEEEQKKEKKPALPKQSGAEALAGSGSSQKRPASLWGIGRCRNKSSVFKWGSAERKGRAPDL